ALRLRLQAPRAQCSLQTLSLLAAQALPRAQLLLPAEPARVELLGSELAAPELLAQPVPLAAPFPLQEALVVRPPLLEPGELPEARALLQVPRLLPLQTDDAR